MTTSLSGLGEMCPTEMTYWINNELAMDENRWALYATENRSTQHAQCFDRFISDSGKIARHKGNFGDLRLIHPERFIGGYQHTNGKWRGRSNPLVHQIMWDTFGDTPATKGMCIDHIDECKSNNHIDNLQLLTIGENVSKSLGDGRRKGDLNPNSKARKALKEPEQWQ